MKKFVEVICHDYMDMYPTTQVVILEESKIHEWEAHMNEWYSGGTTKVSKVLTKDEALSYVLEIINDLVKRQLREKTQPQEAIEDINDLITKFRECYK